MSMGSKVTSITHEDHTLVIKHNVDLGNHSTMRVGGPATMLANAYTADDIRCAYAWAAEQRIQICTIGSGSNIIWSDAGYNGLVLKNAIRAFQVTSQNSCIAELHIGAGEMLDRVVHRTTKMELTGMECLSLIPGTCGGAVIQNSGAYGQELSQALVSVEVYDTHTEQVVLLDRDACNLGYRSSRFKNEEPGRFVVLGFTVKLHGRPVTTLSYPALRGVLGERRSYAPADIRSAVIGIRSNKLPDPDIVPNCGSFFTNPTVSESSIVTVLHGSQAPLYSVKPGSYKVPAAWLIEHCVLKGHSDAELGFGTWSGQPLVVYAMWKSSCENLLQYGKMIETAVKERFGIPLEREPVMMGTNAD